MSYSASNPHQVSPTEPTMADHLAWYDRTRARCEREAHEEILTAPHDWVSAALADSEAEIAAAVDAIRMWYLDGCHVDECPLAEVFGSVQDLMNRAEELCYLHKLKQEGVEE